MNTQVCDLDVSVVVTLMDDRGQTEECLSSWTHRQTFARDRYEVIVVGSGREHAVEAIARPLLSAGDRLITFQGSNELALHDFGARQARGKWLLFTEAHCAAEPSCLAELVAYLQAHERRYAGACIRSMTDGSLNPLARLEERWYREGFETWSREGDWRKVTIRGTALRRDVYTKVGGFKSDFGCFAEILLAAQLNVNGYQLGYASAAAIKHYNSTRLDELLAYVREFREGEVAFRTLENSERFADYFSWDIDWGEASAADRRIALACAARSLRRAMARPRCKGATAMARSMLGLFSSAAVDAVSSGRARLLRAAAIYGWARIQFALSWLAAKELYGSYCALWEAASNLARQRALCQRTRYEARLNLTATPQKFDYQPGEMHTVSMIGFHARECFEGQSFRWSSPLALMRVSVPAGDYEVSLDTKGIGGGEPLGFIDLYLNGQPMQPSDTSANGHRIFHARCAMFRNGASQDLVLTSGRMRGVGPAEHRILGVPVFSITFVPRQ